MKQSMTDTVLAAFAKVKDHLQEELPDRTPVSLLCNFRLGDLRELDVIDRAMQGHRERRDEVILKTAEQKKDGHTILSGG